MCPFPRFWELGAPSLRGAENSELQVLGVPGSRSFEKTRPAPNVEQQACSSAARSLQQVLAMSS
eukprot:12928131-Alexandrium_andersonii.AAC.1